MKEWLQRFMDNAKERFGHFMDGRYGMDDFSRFLNIIVLVFLVVGIFYMPLSVLGIAMFGYNYYRILSRNSSKRMQENNAYLGLRRKATEWLKVQKQRVQDRGTHHFYRCPSCSQSLRVPKGKGNITVTCPKCHTQFKKKS